MVNTKQFLLDGESKFSALVEQELGAPTHDTGELFCNLQLSLDGSLTTFDYKFLVVSVGGVFVLDSYFFSPLSEVSTAYSYLDTVVSDLKIKSKALERWAELLFGESLMLVKPGIVWLGDSNPAASLEERAVTSGVQLLTQTEWLKHFRLNQNSVNPELLRRWLKGLKESGKQTKIEPLRIRDYSELEATDSEVLQQQNFRRVYKAKHGRGKTKALVYTYDLTAGDSEQVTRLGEREYQALFKLGKSQYTPQVIESIREVPHLGGAMKYFSLVDSDAPSIEERAGDASWTISERTHFACRALEALGQIHSGEASIDDAPVIHRNINPKSIRVRSTGAPLFTGFSFSQVNINTTFHSLEVAARAGDNEWQAPEVRKGGLAAASCASDVFSLCKTLIVLFAMPHDSTCAQVLGVLRQGTTDDPKTRQEIVQLVDRLKPFLEDFPQPKRTAALDVKFWDEGTRASLNNKSYQIQRRLGSGGMGSAFLMYRVLTNRDGEEELAPEPVVGKVFTNGQFSQQCLWAHTMIQSVSGGEHLATVFDTGDLSHPNQLSAVLKWIPGESLWSKIGKVERNVPETPALDLETEMLDWVRQICKGLSRLHQLKLVHGDVTPKNIILDQHLVTLTDFDLSGQEGHQCSEARTHQYSAPEVDRREALHCSQDVYSLGASIFHVLTGQEPFDHPTGYEKQKGCNWVAFDRARYPRLYEFIKRATEPQQERRFASADEVLSFLCELNSEETSLPQVFRPTISDAIALSNQEVPWLKDLLSTYQGSKVGNEETRGLDSRFAELTYVETDLDRSISKYIKERRVSLVILCGNAGDGKTAFIQNLAKTLGYHGSNSSVRIWEHRLENGVVVRANLDGSAAYMGKSANEILTEFLAPFSESTFPEDQVHILAINNGKLFEWLDEQPKGSYLAEQLTQVLGEDVSGSDLDPRIRFIDLNERSLVGSVGKHSTSQTDFFDRLVSRMFGREEDYWRSCKACTAQNRCSAWRSVQLLNDTEKGEDVVKRLLRAFRMIHQKGEVHITARNLRGALTYIFFGVHSCRQLHEDPTLSPPPYYERAFNVSTENRQGELLVELGKLDPAIEACPRQDKLLLSLDDGKSISLPGLRRRAYFEGVPGGDVNSSVDVVGGAEFELFERLATKDPIVLKDLCDRLCDGLSRLEDLPEVAFSDPNVVALRVTPHTPTETIFWIARDRERFSLVIPPIRDRNLEWLPFQIVMRFQYSNGGFEDLYMGYGLFHRLLRARDGEQLSDASTDDIYASLSVFKERVIAEESRTLMAWNPMDEVVRRVFVQSDDSRQIIQMGPVG
jgi:serine/threonine protein kinase